MADEGGFVSQCLEDGCTGEDGEYNLRRDTQTPHGRGAWAWRLFGSGAAQVLLADGILKAPA